MSNQNGQNVGQQEVKKGFNFLNILLPIVGILLIVGGIAFITQKTMGNRNDNYAEKVEKMLAEKKAAKEKETAKVEAVATKVENEKT